jgi:hypothetical protein
LPERVTLPAAALPIAFAADARGFRFPMPFSPFSAERRHDAADD